MGRRENTFAHRFPRLAGVVAAILAVPALGAGAVVIIPLCLLFLVLLPISLISVYRWKRRLMVKMRLVDRFYEWPEMEAKLTAGEGTFIMEHKSESAPICLWWTRDDILGALPIPLETRLDQRRDPTEEMSDIARSMIEKYTDEKTGGAKLAFTPRKMKLRFFQSNYPNARIITLLTWPGYPKRVYAGDLERVLGRGERGE